MDIKILSLSLRLFSKTIANIFPDYSKPIGGIWCACWQIDEKNSRYQVGSIELFKVGQYVFGNCHSRDKLYPVTGKYSEERKKNKFQASFTQSGIPYYFTMQNTDDPNHFKGEWSGLLNVGKGKTKEVDSYQIQMCRNEVCYGIHDKIFVDEISGCTIQKSTEEYKKIKGL